MDNSNGGNLPSDNDLRVKKQLSYVLVSGESSDDDSKPDTTKNIMTETPTIPLNQSDKQQTPRTSQLKQERCSTFIAHCINSVISARDLVLQERLKHPQLVIINDPFRKKVNPEMILLSASQQMSKDRQFGSEDILNQILKRLQGFWAGQPSHHSSKGQLYVYILNQQTDCMSLSEIWSFELVLQGEQNSDSNSNSSSTKRRESITKSNGIQIDQNYFQVQPEDVRKNQTLKYCEKIYNLAKSMPVQLLLNSDQELIFENRWEKTKNWRPGQKIISGQEFSTDLYEVGRMTTKVEYIVEADVKQCLMQEQQDKKNAQGNLAPQQSSLLSIFGGLSGLNQSKGEIQQIQGRNRLNSDGVIPHFESRQRNLQKEETKNRQNLNQNVATGGSKKSSDDSRSNYSASGIFSSIVGGLSNMLGGGNQSRTPAVTSTANFTASPRTFSNFKPVQQQTQMNDQFKALQGPTFGLNKSLTSQDIPQRTRFNTDNINKNDQMLINNTKPEEQKIDPHLRHFQTQKAAILTEEQTILVSGVSQYQLDDRENSIIEEIDPQPEEESKLISDRLKNLIVSTELAYSQVMVQENTANSTTDEKTSQEQLQQKLQVQIDYLFELASRSTKSCEMSGSYLSVSKDQTQEQYQSDMRRDFHNILKLQRVIKKSSLNSKC